MIITQATPGFDQANQWVVNNGLGVVVTLIVLLPGVALFGFVIRSLLTDMAKRIDNAVNYFTQKLDAISTRQEQLLDRLDDRLDKMSRNSQVSSDRLVEALNRISETQRAQAVAMGSLTETTRILLTFMTQNMTNVQAHRAVVEPAVTGFGGPTTGVVKPIAEEEHGDHR